MNGNNRKRKLVNDDKTNPKRRKMERPSVVDDLKMRAELILSGDYSSLKHWNLAVNKHLKDPLSEHRGNVIEYIQNLVAALNTGIKEENTSAMVFRAFMHREGRGGERNYAAAIALYDRAIELGDAGAMNHRAFMHREGHGGERNYAAAIALLERAIELGDAGAMNNRAFMHCHGQGGDINYAAAIALFDRAIELGDACAMNNRAFMHSKGHGGDRNYTQTD